MELENLASKKGQSRLYYLHGDHLGTAHYVTDEYGETTQFFLNLPFGETMAEQMTGVYDNPYKFNAKELDQETGFYYYGARYYNPKWSIWHGVDPLAEKMPSWSPYNYTFDNPVRFIDSDGMAPTDIVITGNYRDQVLAQLRGSTDGQLKLSMNHLSGKVTAKAVEGVKLSKASQMILDASNDSCNISELRSDGDYLTDSGIEYRGGAYEGSRMLDDGRLLSTNLVNPMVTEKVDELSGNKYGATIKHELLENILGVLNSPGSPAATSPKNGAKGYDAAHKGAKALDRDYKDLDAVGGRLERKRIYANGKMVETQEYFTKDRKTGKESSTGKFETDKKK